MTPEALASVCLQRLPPWRLLVVAGESGAGKTILASALAEKAAATLLHQDDYFRLAPSENHRARVADLAWVGRGEVDFERLHADIASIREGVAFVHPPQCESPLPVYSTKIVVEGTYALFLDAWDASIFVDRTYQQTLPDRAARGRDAMDPFVETVLQREQPIVRSRAHLATLTVTSAFDVAPSTSERF